MATILYDLQIDPTTLDIVNVAGDGVVITGQQEKAQAIAIALRTFLAEWFLDTTVGWLDFSGTPFGKGKTPAQIQARAVKEILTVAGVLANPAPTAAVTVKGRVCTIAYTAMTDDGIVAGTVTTP